MLLPALVLGLLFGVLDTLQTSNPQDWTHGWICGLIAAMTALALVRTGFCGTPAAVLGLSLTLTTMLPAVQQKLLQTPTAFFAVLGFLHALACTGKEQLIQQLRDSALQKFSFQTRLRGLETKSLLTHPEFPTLFFFALFLGFLGSQGLRSNPLEAVHWPHVLILSSLFAAGRLP